MLRNSLRLIFQHFAFDGLSPPAHSLPKSHHLMRELFPISEKHKLFVNFQSARVIPKVRSKVNMRDYVWVQCAMCIPPNYILPRTFLVIGENAFSALLVQRRSLEFPRREDMMMGHLEGSHGCPDCWSNSHPIRIYPISFSDPVPRNKLLCLQGL